LRRARAYLKDATLTAFGAQSAGRQAASAPDALAVTARERVAKRRTQAKTSVCGIAGIVMRRGRSLDPTVLDRFARALAHRGPDNVGRFENGRTGLVSTRLAIIDLQTGNQPFEAPDGSVLVANGEIYNDPEIRRRNPEAPYRTGSDCESPLHLYCARGLAFAEELRGMYAIAIADQRNDTLILSRDPFGIKPLYYAATPDAFAFASEPQALVAAGLASSRTTSRGRSELLQLKFTTGQATIFSDIRRVLPGETLVVEDGAVRERRVRRAIGGAAPEKAGEADLARRLDAILEDSVRAHMRSDVPYGLFLSGGIDSSVLLSQMARIATRPIAALTARFPDSGAADESAAAARVAHAVGAEHHLVELRKEDFWSLSPRVAAALDDPTADAAALPTFMLAGLAARLGLKVALSGEGADEVFGGYSRYRRATWLWGLLAGKSRTHGVFDGMGGASRAFEGWRDGLAKIEQTAAGAALSPIQSLQAADCAEWLPNDLMVKLDRCLMAHGVEGRTPFLDPVVGPFAFNLPDRMKVRGRFGKWLLREWLSKNLPEAGAFDRKTGFNPPIGEWIGSYRGALEKLVLNQPGIAEMAINDVVRRAFANPAETPQAAWSLVFYALWHSRHVLGVPADGAIDDVLAEAAKRA
jgi:asparagine synthase (glutamine-hydrolysing)